MASDYKPDMGRIFINSILVVYMVFVIVFCAIVCIGKRKLRTFNQYVEQELLLKSNFI